LPIRVVTLINFFQGIGGAERLAVEIALRLDRERFQATVWTSRPSRGPLLEQLEASHVPVFSLARTTPWQLWEWAPFLRYLREEEVDVLHAHGFGSNAWAAVWGALTRVPVVVAHEHTWSFEGQPMRKLIDRHLIARCSDVLLAVSREDRRRMRDVEGIPEDRTRYLPNGIPPLATRGHDVRAELGISRDVPVIGTVSVLRQQKGLDLLIEGAALLVPEFPKLRVLIAGGGFPIHVQRLEAHARALGLGHVVTLLGLRTDVGDVLSAMDVAVSSSRFEGSPLALMEYMAAGKPIVATRVGGVPEIIEDGKSGLLVEPGSVDALARGISTLLRDGERAARMGAEARRRQQAEFDIDTTVRRVEDLYGSLLAERGRRGNSR
jgi:glycosyltransferase involved in cell wall biosynthesis